MAEEIFLRVLICFEYTSSFLRGRDEATKFDIFEALCTLIDGCFDRRPTVTHGVSFIETLLWEWDPRRGHPQEGRRGISVHCCTQDSPESVPFLQRQYELPPLIVSRVSRLVRISMGCAKAGRPIQVNILPPLRGCDV